MTFNEMRNWMVKIR